jgi:hypothetical protein
MHASDSILGQSGAGGAIGWSIVLIVLVVIALVGVMRLRKWFQEEDLPSGGIGFTLSDLRQLHREGKMSDEEFERARSKMVQAGRTLAANLPDPLQGRRPQPKAPRDQTNPPKGPPEGSS